MKMVGTLSRLGLLGLAVLACTEGLVLAGKKQLTREQANRRTITDIIVSGIDKTHPKVVRRELLIKKGEQLEIQLLDDSVQRLKNMRIFRTVEANLSDGADGDSVNVEIALTEKWTTIPIFDPAWAGGTSYLIVGAYDPHVFGRYLRLGAKYEYFAGMDSGAVWFRNPRFLDRRILAGVTLSRVSRLRRLYRDDGEGEGAFTMRQNGVDAFVEYELRSNLRLGGGVEFDDDSFGTWGLSEDEIDAGQDAGFEAPQDAHTVLLKGYAAFGRINYDNYLQSGRLVWLGLDLGSSLWGSDVEFYRLVWDNRRYWLLPRKSNLATRFLMAHTNTQQLQHIFYAGGLRNVRGYKYGRFRGRDFWQANVEFRIPSLDTSRVVVQHVLFADAGGMADTPVDLVTFKNRPFAGVGLGLRVMSPRIYGLHLRLDLALALDPRGAFEFSFGLQQFF